MLMNSRALIGLPVITKSQQPLGKLSNIDIDVSSGQVSLLHVATNRIVPRLVEDELLISWNAVLEVTTTSIIVTDNAVKERIGAIARLTKSSPSTTNNALTKTDSYADGA